MRYYGFSNMYLSSLQQGLQNAHCIVEIQQKYHKQSCHRSVHYNDWARNHKTIVILNGGNQRDIWDLSDYFCSQDNPYAWDYFKEDEQSLNNCTTCVGIIIPEKIYNSAQLIRSRNCVVHNVENDGVKGKWIVSNDRVIEYELTMWEFGLIERLNNCGLAH